VEDSRGDVFVRGGGDDRSPVSVFRPSLQRRSTYPCSRFDRLNTAFQALYSPLTLRLIKPGASTPPEEDTWVFIYGGSSSVGQYAVQLAKLSGYKVATVASPRNHQLLSSLGADLIFDVRIIPLHPISAGLTLFTPFQYHDPQVVDKLKKGAREKIHFAVDTISEPNTQATTVRVLAENKPGKVIVILRPSEEARNIRKDVDIIGTSLPRSLEIRPVLKVSLPRSPATLAPTAYGVNTDYVKTNDEERALLSAFLQNTLPGLIKTGKLKSIPTKLWDGGLDKVDEGLTYLQSGKVSAEKVVFDL